VATHRSSSQAASAASTTAVDAGAAAFRTFYRGEFRRVFGYLLALTGDAAVAEDLAQETFLRAFDRLSGFRFESRLTTWLYRIARNLAVDALRSRSRMRDLPSRLAVPDDRAPGPELRTELDAALGSLSVKLRDALLLVEVAGLTCREAGTVLGVPEGTVKSRLYHARRHLVSWFTDSAEASGE
jgi:RNA polymerase sigma-70 factor, ECF subfamily